MSYFKSYESRGLGAVAARDLAPSVPRTPAQQARQQALIMSRRATSAGLPKYPFTVGVRGQVLPQSQRLDRLVSQIPSYSSNFYKPLSRPVLVPVIERPGAGTTYSGVLPGNPPALQPAIYPRPAVMSAANTPPRLVPAQTSIDGATDAAAEADLQSAALTVGPVTKPNYLLYGGIAAAALGAWWLLGRR